MNPALYLFDDGLARSWDPFLLTRPAGELLFGALTLRERSEKYWGLRCSGHFSKPSLEGFAETNGPAVLSSKSQSDATVRVLQSSRVILSGPAPTTQGQAATLFLDDEVVGWVLPPEDAFPPDELLLEPVSLHGSRRIQVTGRTLDAPWRLMTENADQLEKDIPRLFPGYAADELRGSHILGTGLVSLGTGAVVEPGSVLDVRSGPIRISDHAVVRSHTRLEGPAFIGPGSTILGGVLSQVSIGPMCRVRGEVESTVILGFANKAHDGFLGHAYLGKWVNLGAFTTNSDLKNNYGPVRVGGPHGPRDTGLMKVGCFLGDHVKTGIGTLLTTGTVVGAGSNLFGGAMPPTWVPPFSWGTGSDLTEFRLDKFLEVASRVMGRRGMELTQEMETVLRKAWEDSRVLRTPTP